MRDGFIKVAACTPDVKVADCEYNAGEIIHEAKKAAKKGAKVIVFPELSITSSTCGDLFFHEDLLEEAKEQLLRIARETADVDGIIFVGLPVEYKGKLYNAAAGVSHGEVLGFVPKTYLANSGSSYELRYFASGEGMDGLVTLKTEEEIDEDVWFEEDEFDVEFDDAIFEDDFEEEDFDIEDFDMDESEEDMDEEFYDDGLNFEASISPYMMFVCTQMPKLKIAVEIGTDLWAVNPPSSGHIFHGANLIVNLFAGEDIVGKNEYQKMLVNSQSGRGICGYVLAAAGSGESTQDAVFGGQNLIAENGVILAEGKRFENETVYGDIDIQKLTNERRRVNTFTFVSDDAAGDQEHFYNEMNFELLVEETKFSKKIDSSPFIPSKKVDRERRCDEILHMQALGLKKRLAHIHCQNAVIGLSGGLDSTLALLVIARAFDMLGMERKKITAVTMPCFGTTDRTYNNACLLSKKLGTELKEINIKDAVNVHFKDICQDPEKHDVTYENAQARERTQILMDLANQTGGIVIGTGDLSELALGWATYNGDHMSMYGVNGSIPKTLVRHLVKYYADTCKDKELSSVLLDILDTPVSPELLPPKDGVIAQKTEDLVGPYELHDFFMYYMLRWAFSPKKIYRLAKNAFAGEYDEETILKWLKTFYRRFFTQQFKRSCLPDGPKVGSVAVSPRGDLRMPSDASMALWMKTLDKIEI